MHAPERRKIILSAVTMVTILLITALAIAGLSRPAPRYAYVTARIPRFALPQQVKISLPGPDAIHIRDSQLSLTNMTRLEVTDRRTSKCASSETTDTLKISDASGVSSALEFTTRGAQGEFLLVLPPGTVVSAECDALAKPFCVQYTPPKGRRIRVNFQSETFSFSKAVRVRLEPSLLAGEGPDGPTSYALHATSPTSMVVLAGTVAGAVTVSLSNGTSFSTLPDPRHGVLTSFFSEDIRLSNGKLVEVAFRGVEDAQLSLAATSETRISPAGQFDWVAVTATKHEDEPTVLVSGRGFVESLRQDGRELLPSILGDVLGADPKTRGLWGGITLFVISSGLLLLKRATDNLVRLILPD